MNPRLLYVVKIKVTCRQLRDNQRNDEWPRLLVKVGRRSHGMNGVCRQSTRSYCGVGSRLTALIMETPQMSDLGRQQKHPYLRTCTQTHTHTHRRKHVFTQFTPHFHCHPVPLTTATYRILSHCKLSLVANDTTHRNRYILCTSVNDLYNPRCQFVMLTLGQKLLS